MVSKKRIQKTIFTLTFIVMLLLVSCTAEEQTIQEKEANAEPATEETELEAEEESIEEAIVEEESQYQRISQETYLGIWMPSIPGEQSLEKAEDLLAIGANTIEFGVIIPYNSQGKVLEQGIEYDTLRETIINYKNAGLTVALVLEPFPAQMQGEPGPVPANIRNNFVASYTNTVISIAEIAEEYQVEVFSPMNEQDYKLGVETASNFGQEILPPIQEVFTGDLLWKGSLFEHVGESTPDIDFSGYDIVGFSSFPFTGIDRYPQAVRNYEETIGQWAQEDGVTRLWAAEFGTYEPVPISPSDEDEAVSIVFGETNIEGYFVFDPPRGFGTAIKGSDLYNVVQEGFESKK